MNKLSLRLGMVLAAAMAASVAGAATFSANGGVGSSTIGTAIGDDYPTLEAAGADFTDSAQAVTGNYTFNITSDLSESVSARFGKATAGNVVTIKPAATNAGVVTVTYAQAADNAGATGDLIIGVNSLASLDAVVKTDGFVVDGSKNGTNSRDLTFAHVAAFSARSIVVHGDSDNVTIKNVNVAITGTAAAPLGIRLTIRGTVAPAGLILSPDNAVIDNNSISVLAGGTSQGFSCGNSGTVPGGNAILNLTVTNNDIVARTRGIFLDFLGGANGIHTVTGNKVRVLATSTGLDSSGIVHNSSNGTTDWTMTIATNEIPQLETPNPTAGNFGMTGINASGGPTSPLIGSYNIFNNSVYGFRFTGAAADQLYRGIRTGSSSVNFNVYNNSINMPDFASVSGVTSTRVVGIGSSGSPAGAGGIQRYSSNLVRILEPTGLGLHRAGTPPSAGTFSSDYNNVYAPNATGNGGYGRYELTSYLTLAAWQAAPVTPDLNGGDIDPTATAGSAWDATLHFVPPTTQPAGLIPGEPGLVSVDRDNESRSATFPYPGSDEIPGFPLPVSLSGFSIE